VDEPACGCMWTEAKKVLLSVFITRSLFIDPNNNVIVLPD